MTLPSYISRQFHRTSNGENPFSSLQWRHNGRDGFSNHQPHDGLLNRLFRNRWKKTPKLRVTGYCVGNSPVTGEFHVQRASNTEKVSIWWRHHEFQRLVFRKIWTTRSHVHALVMLWDENHSYKLWWDATIPMLIITNIVINISKSEIYMDLHGCGTERTLCQANQTRNSHNAIVCILGIT